MVGTGFFIYSLQWPIPILFKTNMYIFFTCKSKQTNTGLSIMISQVWNGNKKRQQRSYPKFNFIRRMRDYYGGICIIIFT